jgi:hypothetical protein
MARVETATKSRGNIEVLGRQIQKLLTSCNLLSHDTRVVRSSVIAAHHFMWMGCGTYLTRLSTAVWKIESRLQWLLKNRWQFLVKSTTFQHNPFRSLPQDTLLQVLVGSLSQFISCVNSKKSHSEIRSIIQSAEAVPWHISMLSCDVTRGLITHHTALFTWRTSPYKIDSTMNYSYNDF